MIRLLRRISRGPRRFAKDTSGTATLEFVLMFPLVFYIFASGIEAGLLMTRNVMLERAVDISVRDLRLGDPSPPTWTEFRDQICQIMLANEGYSCLENLQVELQRVSSDTWTPLDLTARCVDKPEDIDPTNPNTIYETGENNDFMLVRACLKVDPLFPNYALGAILSNDGANRYALVAVSAFVNEPSR